MHLELELNQVDETDGSESAFMARGDIKDVELDLKKVRGARRLEMGYVRSRRVYKYAKRAEAIRLGHKIIGVKWVDTNKGDEEEENYRSRLVARRVSQQERRRAVCRNAATRNTEGAQHCACV